jgi:uncharacterized protein
MRFVKVFLVILSPLLVCGVSSASDIPEAVELERKQGAEQTNELAAPKQSPAALLKAKNVDLDKPISEQDMVAPVLNAQSKPGADNVNEKQPSTLDSIKPAEDTAVISDQRTVNDTQSIVTPTAGVMDTISAEETGDSSSKSDLVEWVEETALEEVPEGTGITKEDETLAVELSSEKETKKPFVLLGAEVPPATSTRLAWAPHQSFEGINSATPVLVVNGKNPGPTLCLTASIHGDELNGIETVRRVLYNLEAESLNGAVIGVPIVNLQSFRRGSRYLSDRRDLNRFFPGDPNGSSASRIAHSFFNEIVKHCSAVVDIHTGSFYRTNLPQLRADLTNPKVVKMTQGFGSTVVLHSVGAVGTMRRAAVSMGIPTVTLEAGAPMVLDETSVSQSVKGIHSLLNQLSMVSKFSLWGTPEPAYYTSSWQRAQVGGIIFSNVKLGALVKKGDVLGTITNPITNVRKEVISEYNGRILGMALNQVVQPGFAAYHVGITAPEDHISDPQEVTSAAPLEAGSTEAVSLPPIQQVSEAPADTETASAHIESE